MLQMKQTPTTFPPETTPGMMLQIADAAIVACNPRAAEILGYTTEQLIGTTAFDPLWQTVREDGSPFGLEEDPAIVAWRSRQPVTDVVMGFYRPDGKLVWLKLDSQPLFQANATAPYAVATTIWDITAQKRQEAAITARALPDKEALNPYLIELDTIYTTAPIGLCFVDPDLRFVRINQQLADINGLSISEHLGRSLRDVLPEQADELEPLYRQAIASGKPKLNIEFHGISHALPKVERDWIVNLYPLKQPNGRVLGVNVMVQDVTERKRLERDLRAANRQIATIWDSMTDAYLSLDREWRLTYANQAAIQLVNQLTHLEAREFMGKTYWEIFPWSVGRVVEQQYRRAVTEQVAVHFEVLYEPTQTWFEIHAYPAAAGLGIYWRDISDRKQAEADRHASEHLYRTLFESIDEGFCVCEMLFNENGEPTDYRFLEVNPVFEKMTGLQQAVGKTARELVPNLEDFWVEVYGRVALTGEPVRFENQSLAMNRWFDVNAFRIGEPQSHKFALLFTNISDRKRAEIALQERHARLNLLYETTSGLLLTEQPLTFMNDLFDKLSAQLDLQYYFNFIIEERNRRQLLHLKSYAGISPAAAQAIEWLELSQGMCGLVAQARRQIVANNVQQSTLPNAQIIREMGITAYVGQPLIVRGRLLGTLSFASTTRTSFSSEEIALLQAATDQIAVAIERANLIDSLQQQTQQLIQTNRLKDEFLAVLSHELRSPLNPILGWVKLLQTRKFNETKTAEALATIERNAQLQAQLIEDLLDISRIMRGKIALNATPVNLTYVISSALETVRLAAEAKSMQLQVTLASHALQVFGDATRLQQVVWNLLSNAIKFTPHGGRVEISLQQVEERQGSRGASEFPSYAQIQVADTGKGIDPEFLPHVFEYFRQEDGSTTRKFGGLGLGLAIAKQVVEMHGGTIDANSPGEGRGATFTVKIPLMQSPEAAPADTPIDSTPQIDVALLANVRVLLVDDDADTCEFLRVFLEEKGAVVASTNSATKALQILAQFSPDILLSDIGMPDTDGYELIRTIRSSTAAGSIPAIALTAYAQDVDREQAIAAGFQYHVVKPLDLEAVVALIVELLSNKK